MLLSCILYLDFYSTQSTMQVDTITQLYNISRISVKMETAFFLSKECAACNFTVPSWRKWHVSSKEMQLCTKPHSVTSQKKTISFIIVFTRECYRTLPWASSINFAPLTLRFCTHLHARLRNGHFYLVSRPKLCVFPIPAVRATYAT